MVRQTATTIILEIIGGLILLALLAVGVLAFMLANGPVELGIFRDDVERALTNTRDGRPVSLDKVYLEWSPSQKRVTVTADGIAFRDAQGALGGSAKRAEIVLDASSLILGKIEPLRMHLQSGELLAEETGEGWSVAGEAPFPITLPEGKAPKSPAEVLDAANRGLQASLGTLRAANSNLSLEALSFEDFIIIARNTKNEEVFRISEAKGALERTNSEVSLSLAAGGGDGLPETLSVSLAAPADFAEIRGELGLQGWSLEALTAQFDLPEGMLKGEVSGLSMNAAATTGGGLQQAGLELEPSKIAVRAGARNLDFEELGFNAKYDVTNDGLDMDIVSLQHERLSGPLRLTLSDVLKGGGEVRDFELSSPALKLDVTPVFSRAWPLKNVSASGRVDFKQVALDADKLVFDADGLKFHGSGKFARKEKRVESDLPFILEMTAKLTGPVGPDIVLDYWPVKLGKGARDFIKERILKATLSEAEVAVNIRQDSYTQGFLADEALIGKFTATDVTVKFLDDVPAIDIPVGTGQITGNSFVARASEGTLSSVSLTEGVYEQPQFNPKGGDFRVYAKAAGDVQDIVKIVSDSRLQLQARTGFDPETLSGTAEGELELFRPALRQVPPDALRFTVKGQTANSGLKKAAYNIDLTDASTRVDITQKSMTVAGYGQWGAMPIQFTWRDGFDDGDAPSSLSATSIIDPDVMNRFGFLGRTYLTGEAPVEIQATTNGQDLVEANIAIELESARVDIAELGWSKPAGEPGRATVNYKPSEGAPAATAYFEADDLLIDGDFVLGQDNKLLSADLRRAFLDKLADVGGTVRRSQDGGLNVKLTGDFLDISGAMAGFDGEESVIGDVSLSAEVSRLKLREGIVVSEADVALANNASGLQAFSARGTLSDDSEIAVAYDVKGDGGATIDIAAGNAGFLTEAMLGGDFISGGSMKITGTLASRDQPTKLDIKVRDARLHNAPFLTQILSLASLQGLTDTLAGEGVRFSSIDLPLSIAKGRYTISGARAQGPALGLTANGWVEFDTGILRVDGVLVPSFGINSALGGVPILGDLFVSRDGEGVFSLTYGVRGTLSEANVSVNPLSAITPGVLRRVFENPAEEPLPKGDPTKPPPPPVAPLPPPEEF